MITVDVSEGHIAPGRTDRRGEVIPAAPEVDRSVWIPHEYVILYCPQREICPWTQNAEHINASELQ